MGFNKIYVDTKKTIKALENDNLKGYYGKSDVLIFEDNISSDVYSLFKEGISDKEILTIIKKRMEEKTYEVY
jgi:hypothetical protein